MKAVHGDVKALLVAGVLTRAPDGRIEFPFEKLSMPPRRYPRELPDWI